jgi:UrcA family protein
MFKLSNTLAGLATLTLAAVPALALTTSAHAAPAIVKISDLDLTSRHGVSVLDKRITVAAQDVCDADGRSPLKVRAACIESVRQEAHEKLGAQVAAASPSTQLAQR